MGSKQLIVTTSSKFQTCHLSPEPHAACKIVSRDKRKQNFFFCMGIYLLLYYTDHMYLNAVLLLAKQQLIEDQNFGFLMQISH